ncbi:MAG: c-type cytochrome biogenesis protein CcmI [Neptuniibacter sp.]
MIQLWIGIAVLTVFAIAFVYLPILRARKALLAEETEDRETQNIEIFRERLSELDQEKSAGNLDEQDYNTLKTELERNLLTDVQGKSGEKLQLKLTAQSLVTVTLLALLIPVSAIGLYSIYGRAPDLEISLQQPKDPFNGQQPTLEEAIAQLEMELKSQPENAEGWFLLATTYLNQGRFAESADSFRKVLEILPEDAPQYAGVMGQLAQALFFQNGNQVTDDVRVQINKTLALEPYEITALGLLGVDAFEKQDYRAALDLWLTALRNADGQSAESLRSGVIRARDKLVEAGEDVPEIPELEDAKVSLRVQLAEVYKDQVSADQDVFVFAREVGGRMPLAAVKLKVSDLPADVVLDDSQAMNPEIRLSSVPTVEISARISKTGQPQAAVGDIYTTISPVQVRGNKLPLILNMDRVVE